MFRAIAYVCVFAFCLLDAAPVMAYKLKGASDWKRHAGKKDPAKAGASYNHWHYDATGTGGADYVVTRTSPYADADVRNSFLGAMTAWNQTSPSLFRFDTASIGNASGVFHQYSDAYHDFGWAYEDATWLAVTVSTCPSIGYYNNGADIYFNTKYSWSFSGTATSGKHDFKTVATHELGHVMGSDHTANTTSVMQASIGSNTVRPLTTDDRKVMQYLYGGILHAGVTAPSPSNVAANTYYVQRFYFRVDGGFGAATSTVYLDISTNTPGTTLSVAGYSSAFSGRIGSHTPGNTIYKYSGSSMTAVHPLISGWLVGPASGTTYYIDVGFQTTSTSGVTFRYRANYIDETTSHEYPDLSCLKADGAYREFGDLAPRGSGTSIVQDQQGFYAYTLTIPPPSVPTCSYAISPSSATGAAGGGTGSIQVNSSPSGCTGGSWSSSSNAAWLTLTGTTSGSGPGTWQVPYSYGVNGPSTRQGTVSFTGASPSTFTLTQNPSSQTCTYTISPGSATGAGSGGTGSIQVSSAPAGCTGGSWSAASNAAWLTLTGTTNGSGSGIWQVPYSYTANPSTSSTRTGTISIAGSTFTLTQNPATATPCTYGLSPSSSSAPATAGTGSVQVSGSPGGCSGSWSASSTQGWLTLTGTTSGSGSGMWSVPYSYAANPGTSARTASINIPGSSFTLTQSGVPQGQPNLAPYLPSGWPDKLVITRDGSSHYLDWAVANTGTGEAAGFYIDVMVDGALYEYWYVDQLSSNYYVYVLDYLLGQLTPGTHTVSIIADSLNGVAESNESDNVYTRSYVVGGAASDFSDDGYPDIVWRHTANGGNYLWFMNGSSIVGALAPRALADTNWRIIGVGDFDRDGEPDIAWRHIVTGENYLWYMNGAAQSGGTALPSVTDLNWSAVAVADMNRDGAPDILWRNTATGAVWIWLMNNTTIASVVDLGVVADPQWRIEGAADMNGDGSNDILWRHYGTGEHYIWLMNGTSRSGTGGLPSVTDTTWEIEALADYDGNGSADIVWRQYTTGANYMWLMNGMTPTWRGELPAVHDLQWRIAGPH